MIKFFRKIRHNLFSEGKTSKYLKYAIGEIILVVVGILIALQINNWNENRKQLKTTKLIYKIIMDDLKTDIADIDMFLNNYNNIRKPVFETLLNNIITKADFDNQQELNKGFRGFEDIQINTRGYELFKNQPNTSVIEEALASEVGKFYNEHLYEIAIAQRELSQEFANNNLVLKSKGLMKAYFDNTDTNIYIDYMCNDPEAKNRLSSYYLFYSIYAEELENFKMNGEILIEKIVKFINDEP